MKTLKIIASIVLTAAVLLVSMGYLSFRRVEPKKDMLFTTENVVSDIGFISRKHHSIMHPQERAGVRDYLFDRLAGMGGEPMVLEYDSIPSRFGGTMDIADVYCKFEPEGDTVSSSYLLLVAHMDSRFPEETPDGTVCSYGAADDGYGLGVILEITRGALTYSDQWSQGLKILFTDSEEHELDGIRYALERDAYLFDNVGLVMNVEARGVKGPCLLFETSEGNSRLMDFYVDNAVYPYTYSLTSVVYRIMPNYTDFTHLKTEFPGYNFSVIDNLHYYHNDKDNFSNIHPEAITHYGMQMEPMVREFLTGDGYSDPDCMRSDSDRMVFTVPGLTTFCLSRNENVLFNVAVLAMFVLAVASYLVFGRIKIRKVLVNALWIFVACLGIAGLGTGLVFCLTSLSGIPFSFTSVKFMDLDWLAASLSLLVMIVVYLAFFIRKSRASENFVFEHALGAVLVVLVLSAVLLFTTGENFFLIFPAACMLAGLLLHVMVYMNIMSLPAFLLVVMAVVPFLYNLYTALTVGALGLVMFLAFIYLIMMTYLMRCFMRQRR